MKTAAYRLAMFAALGVSVLASGLACSSPVKSPAKSGASSTVPRPAVVDTALFAGGCFWSMEYGFEGRPGVLDVTSGYSGGHTVNPTYDDVNTETTGHMETVQVIFDPRKVSYEKLLDLYWHRIDPTQTDGQFCDRGSSYMSSIFWRNDGQRRAAEASKREMTASLKAPIVTRVVKAGPFYRAEEYHQDFYKKSAAHYHAYSLGCGRDRKLDQMWGAKATHGVVK